MILVQEAESHIEEMEMEMVSSTSPPEKTALKPTAPSNHQLIVPVASNRGNNSTLQAPLSSPGKVEKNGHAKESHHTARVFEIHSLPNGKTRNLLKAVIRRKLSQQKEKKATQMLAIVLGESVPCLPWAPCANPSPCMLCRLIFQPPSEFFSLHRLGRQGAVHGGGGRGSLLPSQAQLSVLH